MWKQHIYQNVRINGQSYPLSIAQALSLIKALAKEHPYIIPPVAAYLFHKTTTTQFQQIITELSPHFQDGIALESIEPNARYETMPEQLQMMLEAGIDPDIIQLWSHTGETLRFKSLLIRRKKVGQTIQISATKVH